MLEDNKQELKAIQERLTRDEYDKSFYLFAGKMALKNSLPKEAIDYLQQAVALDPEYMEAILVLMSVYASEEHFEDIISLYEELKRDEFDWTALYPFVAEAYDKEEQIEKAYEIYSSAYNEFKEDVAFLEKYCYFLLEEGKQDEAKQVVERLIAIEPSEQQWLDLMGRFE